jgi:hypothetical protein
VRCAQIVAPSASKVSSASVSVARASRFRFPRVAVAQRGRVVRVGRDDRVMAQNFLACDREQELLLPPSLREWLPEGHLAWFVIDAVAGMDLSAFYAAY